MERCDCGGFVPREDGPVHAYMHSAPACWRRYGELTVRMLDRQGPGAALSSHVDCYATQHTRGVDTDRRQRQSVAVHLVALSLCLDHGVTGAALARARGRTSAVVLPRTGMADWPMLTPPDTFGPITAPSLYAVATEEFPALAARWPATTWDAWAHQHDVVREWARLVLAATR